jgi:hypothetical protein
MHKLRVKPRAAHFKFTVWEVSWPLEPPDKAVLGYYFHPIPQSRQDRPIAVHPSVDFHENRGFREGITADTVNRSFFLPHRPRCEPPIHSPKVWQNRKIRAIKAVDSHFAIASVQDPNTEFIKVRRVYM